MIEIKSLFSDWKEVSKEQAKKYAEWLIKNLPEIKGEKNKIVYIEQNRLRGITYSELMIEG